MYVIPKGANQKQAATGLLIKEILFYE